MTRRNPVFNLDFPGALTAVIVLGAMAVVFAGAWPWFVLHGTARLAVGIGWSVFLGLIGVLVLAIVIVSRRDV